nr:immunoglobulin light chain junction region [Macaca mulatta]MOX70552.1 immunoglobulin light chain junction region [Macaca mulatta]MOX74667.1 immunoglobulin light chain junction region [Macaca mulatta]MOX76367.1 immunoglobulin light chain junction region [Macaca mulatta]MOX76387.1 immunoglobulin light chain junction region [Macaca mulatta]
DYYCMIWHNHAYWVF